MFLLRVGSLQIYYALTGKYRVSLSQEALYFNSMGQKDRLNEAKGKIRI